VAEFMKKLNKMLRIETRLLIVFHSQTDGQMEQMNQVGIVLEVLYRV